MCDSHQRTPKLLQMLLAALVYTKSQAVDVAKHCQTRAHAGHKTARIGFWPPNTVFGCRDKRLSSGEWLTAVSASWKKYDTSATAVRLRHSAVWNMEEVTLTARHLNAAFWKQNKWKLAEIP
jgi:hypothetical protein